MSKELRVTDMRTEAAKPTPGMLDAMVKAEVGQDVYGDDPSVNNLQVKAAKLLGKEAGLFVPSGSMANLISIMAHCPHRGDEIIVGDQSHIVVWEQGSAAQLAGVHSRQVKTHPDGTLDLDDISRMINDGTNPHHTHTKVICLENTHNATGGTVLPLSHLEKVREIADAHNLQIHLDGARVFNAATALGVPVSDVVQHMDSVMFCLSKGLGAPVGSVIVGRKEFISRCHRHRKALGGGMRQPGMLAAAGIYALDNIAPKMANDHINAKGLARGLQEFPGIEVDTNTVQSNMVFFNVHHPVITAGDIVKRMRDVDPTEPEDTRTSIIKIIAFGAQRIRVVFYHQITEEDVRIFLRKLKHILSFS